MKIHANDPEREIVQTFPNGMRDREHFAKWRTFNCQKCVIGNTQIPDPGTIRPGLGYRIPDTPRQARRKPVGAFLSARLSYTSPRRPTRRRAAIPDQRQGYRPPAPDAPPRGYPRQASGFSTPGPGERRDSGKVPLYRNFGPEFRFTVHQLKRRCCTQRRFAWERAGSRDPGA